MDRSGSRSDQVRLDRNPPGGDTDRDSSSVSSASLKRKRQRKRKSRKERNSRSSMAEDDPPVGRVSPARSETPGVSTEPTPGGSEVRVTPPAFGGSEEQKPPKGPEASTDSSQSPTPLKGVLAASKKKYGKFDQSPPKEVDLHQPRTGGLTGTQSCQVQGGASGLHQGGLRSPGSHS